MFSAYKFEAETGNCLNIHFPIIFTPLLSTILSTSVNSDSLLAKLLNHKL